MSKLYVIHHVPSKSYTMRRSILRAMDLKFGETGPGPNQGNKSKNTLWTSLHGTRECQVQVATLCAIGQQQNMDVFRFVRGVGEEKT